MRDRERRRYVSLKERHRYRDISWLMPSVDVVEVLERLGVQISEVKGDEVWGYCPDHHLFVKRADGAPKEPSHPKWSVNVETGFCHCYTEPRGSNLVWVVRRLKGGTPDEVAAWMVGEDMAPGELELARRKRRRKEIRGGSDGEERPPVAGLDTVRSEVENRWVSEACYEYFMRPPGKAPTNIRKKTVDHFDVYERTWGFYVNRAMIPHRLRGEMVGFEAIDLLGKKRWLEIHPDDDEGDYRKVRYPANFPAGNVLYGFDEVAVTGLREVILVEAARERMKLWQEGFPGALGLNGCHLCDGHMLLLAELVPEKVVIMLDGDDAGRRASWKIAETLRRQFSVEIALTPWGSDPKVLGHKDIGAVLKNTKKID